MKKLINTIVLVCLTLMTSVDVMSETDNTNEEAFSGNLKLGFAKMSGNVDMESLNYGLLLAHKKGKNKVLFKVTGNETEVNDSNIQKDILTSLLDIYNFNQISAVYGKLSYLENEFIGYKSHWKLGAGYLHTWLKDGEKKFNTRIGYQARKFKDIFGEHDSQDFFLAGFRGSYPIMENILLGTEANYEVNFADEEDYEADIDISLTFKVNKQIDIGIDYKEKYDNRPITGVEQTDRILTTNLIYKF